MSETLDAINALAEEQRQLYSELCGIITATAASRPFGCLWISEEPWQVRRLHEIERELALLWERRRAERVGLAEEVLCEWEGWGRRRPRRFPVI